MTVDYREQLRQIHTFPSLVRFLRDELDWPIETDDFEELTFDYSPEELGIDAANAAKIEEIKRLRPLVANQPWGIFFVKFEPKQLPVVALRRILNRVVVKKRATGSAAEQQKWAADDLLFISAYGDDQERRINFAHFSQDSPDSALPTLKVLAWDERDTGLHLDDVAHRLLEYLAWPADPDESSRESWRQQWSLAFELEHREVVTTSRELAIELADLARAVRDRISGVLEIETEDGAVTRLMTAFRAALIHDLEPDEFADMYAQTIAYGLLSARIASPSRGQSAERLPVTNPFLKELMETFLHLGDGHSGGGTGIDFDELGVNEVVELLDRANMEAVVRDFGDSNPLEDPVIHFYELFLKEYDAKTRMQRGVFYTPRPVVSYIVRSVDELLRTEFGLEDGLADITTWREMADSGRIPRVPQGVAGSEAFVQILDPATGTGTFLVEAIELIHETLVAKWRTQGHTEHAIGEMWNRYVPESLLPRLHGYELLMAPYAIAHLKIGLKLHETGYLFGSDQRARVFLTNALEPATDIGQLEIEGLLPALAHEAQAVNDIKRDARYTVIVGNPPYARLSSNHGAWIGRLVRDYYEIDGVPLGERNPKNLQDDYVKFIRLSQALLGETGCGVLGFITNHGYALNPTFRGMRHSLMSAFGSLTILDLHGNTKSGELPPAGIHDENVFDIQQGVAIFFGLRGLRAEGPHVVRVMDMWGDRQHKYGLLLRSSVLEMAAHAIEPSSPFFLFARQNSETAAEYREFASLNELMPTSSAGFVTSRDDFVVAFERSALVARLNALRDNRVSDADLRDRYGLRSLPDSARVKFDRRDDPLDVITKCEFRPFDRRYIAYAEELLERPRKSFFENLELADNVALLSARTNKSAVMDHVFCTRLISERKCAEASTGSAAFPLFVKGEVGPRYLGRTVNFSADFLEQLGSRMSLPSDEPIIEQLGGPSTILSWIYAILHSAEYRSRYREFLRIDFPRVPFPGSAELFDRLVPLGNELIGLHLLESPELDDLVSTYVGPTDPEVKRVSWSDDVVWLDAPAATKTGTSVVGTSGFHGVPQDVWNFQIGGYQVCEKWLKDRKGRVLSEDEIAHYQKIVVAISETIRVMDEIDRVIAADGGWPGAFIAHTAERVA